MLALISIIFCLKRNFWITFVSRDRHKTKIKMSAALRSPGIVTPALSSSSSRRSAATARNRVGPIASFRDGAPTRSSRSSLRFPSKATIGLQLSSSRTRVLRRGKSRSGAAVRAFFGGEASSNNEEEEEFKKIVNDVVYVDPVVGSKRFSNYFWASVVTTGASGFLITGASAYFHHNLVFFLDASEIDFFPQGLVMSFYGIAGLLLATYLWLTINWNVGAGYNEFNKEEGIFRIFRYGFPGKNRRVNLLTDLKDVTAVRVEISEGLNPRRVVYVKCKGKGDIPLTRIGQPLTLAEVERQAAELAKFLQVPIEGL